MRHKNQTLYIFFMTGTELQRLLDAHCLDMKANMPGFLFYGILSCKDGTILSKASANEESSRIVEQRFCLSLNNCRSSEKSNKH